MFLEKKLKSVILYSFIRFFMFGNIVYVDKLEVKEKINI